MRLISGENNYWPVFFGVQGIKDLKAQRARSQRYLYLPPLNTLAGLELETFWIQDMSSFYTKTQSSKFILCQNFTYFATELYITKIPTT
jgi:hypothetical protein